MAPQSQQSAQGTRRTCRTKAQIEEDLLAAGVPTGSKPTPAAVRRSRMAATERDRMASANAGTKSTRDSPTLDHVDYQTIITYLSKPHIRNALFGGGSHTRVSGQPMNPRSLLNPLAIKLNNNYNIRHNTTVMQLNGRILYQRLKRYKSKYASARAFSIKTGSGLSAKNVADGIHMMEDLLESMCPCYKDMDALFHDKGNVTPFGILDSGVGPNSSDKDNSDHGDVPANAVGAKHVSDGETTDGHDHSAVSPRQGRHIGPAALNDKHVNHPLVNRMSGDESEGSHAADLATSTAKSNPLNKHYRSLLNEEISLSSPPPTPKEPTNAKETNEAFNVIKPVKASKLPVRRVSKPYDCKLAQLTPEELALDASSEDEGSMAVEAINVIKPVKASKLPFRRTSGPGRVSKPYDRKLAKLTPEELALDASSEDKASMAVTPATQSRGGSRATLSRRALNPLPSINPSTVHSKENKHSLAHALKEGNNAKIQMLTEANEWRQRFESNRMRADSEARTSALSWDKERYFLDRQEQRDAEARQLAKEVQKERSTFCQRLVMEGKTPEELEAYIRLIYPESEAA